MKRKLLILFVLLGCTGLWQTVLAQEKMSLQKALTEIQKVYGTKFSYQEELVRDIKVSLTLPLNRSQPVEGVLKKILYPNRLLFLYVQENYFTVIRDNRAEEAQAEEDNRNIPEPNYRTITGKVTDSKGKPIIGATVIPEGSAIRQGAITNSDGQYVLRLLQEADAIVFTYLGMVPEKVKLDKGNIVNARLEDEDNMLKEVEVVSIGYAKIPKDRAPGSYGKVTAKEIKEVPAVNILEKLEGQVPGVQIDLKQNTIRIRGNNSFGSSTPRSPLIVVDGFPVMETDDRAGNLSDMVSGTTSGGAILNRYNPEDIESITVLKDAAASSIWGAKAANGVIVIETKKGKIGEPTINFGLNLSLSAPADIKKLQVMNSAQYIDLERELKDLGFVVDNYQKQDWQSFNSNRPLGEALEWMFKVDRGTATAAQRDEALARLAKIDNRDQMTDLLFQRAVSQQYNLSFSGGSNKSTYYISTNYTKDIPIMKANKGESFFINSTITNKLFNDRVNLNMGLNYNYSTSLSNPAASNTIGSSSLSLRPYELLQDENGNNIQRSIRFRDEVNQEFQDKGYLPWTYSALDELDAINYNSQYNRFRFNADINTKITDGVTFSVLGSLQRNIEDTENISRPESYYVRDMVNYGTTVNTNTGRLIYGVPNGGVVQLKNYNGWEYNLRSQVNADKNIGNLINLTILAGAEIRQTRYQSSEQTRYGFTENTYSNLIINPTIPYENVEGWTSMFSSSDVLKKSITRAMSYYSNAAVSALNGKYVLSGSVRFDDFTLTGAKRNQRAKPLWSTGIKWNAKMESFVKDMNWLNALDFRLTYGITGTLPTGIGSYVRMNTSTDNQTNEPIGTIDSPANNQISWEKVKTFNFGTDFSILNNRLTFNIDVYNKRTSDILYYLPFNPTYGWTNLQFNSASMKSNGFELGMKADLIKQGNFGWTSMFNFSYNTNEVTDNRFIKNTSFTLVSGSTPTVGLPLDYMYAYRWAGLDAKGQSQIYNKNGEIVSAATGNNTLSADDLVYQGRTTAPYFGAFNNNFRYKNFNLGVRIAYSMGNVLRRPSAQNYPDYAPYQGLIGAQSDLALRWRQPGDEAITNVPGLKDISYNSINRYINSDLLTISGSHIRLQQITLGYSAPSALLRGTPFKSANINASVRNLGLIWRKNKDGIDPTYVFTNNYSNLPPAKSFFLSINTSF
ncbi:SusC/RagA family TonB-linked outer membrane protein [Pedobacter sp. AW31-3R]|uniref:SusC/RagA family TonB-linked outer membrane protein n=1 Tax=Pedobacter sp. AW31-3R TaxID=3445781 RepID=UPI003F9F9F22